MFIKPLSDGGESSRANCPLIGALEQSANSAALHCPLCAANTGLSHTQLGDWSAWARPGQHLQAHRAGTSYFHCLPLEQQRKRSPRREQLPKRNSAEDTIQCIFTLPPKAEKAFLKPCIPLCEMVAFSSKSAPCPSMKSQQMVQMAHGVISSGWISGAPAGRVNSSSQPGQEPNLSNSCSSAGSQPSPKPSLPVRCGGGTHSQVLPARVTVQAVSDVIAQAFSKVVHELSSLQGVEGKELTQHSAPGMAGCRARPLTGVIQLLSNLSFTSSGGRNPPGATETGSRVTSTNISTGRNPDSSPGNDQLSETTMVNKTPTKSNQLLPLSPSYRC